MIHVRETIADKKKRANRILSKLKRLYPEADCALQHKAAWQLLISTILSAQSTDETVNRVTQALYKKYRRPADFVKVRAAELEQDIRPTGFFRQKTKSVQGACKMLVEEFAGQVPQTMEELTRLPGVARKTANVVLGTWFNKNEGVVVDTHIGRLAERLSLTWNAKNSKDAVKIERDLMEVIPKKQWTFVGHALIWHGRRVCDARKPDCNSCTLTKDCPSAFTFEETSKSRRTGIQTSKLRRSRRRVS